MMVTTPTRDVPEEQAGLQRPGRQPRRHPGPAGPDGSYATNLWTWSLAMNSASKNKLAAWLFIQWATGKEAQGKATAAAFADPTRKSVFDGSFKQTLSAFPGYLETFERVVDSTKIQFTPQTSFFEHRGLVGRVQEIYAGQDAKSRLDALAAASTRSSTPPDPTRHRNAEHTPEEVGS